jgi:hypothetical protein
MRSGDFQGAVLRSLRFDRDFDVAVQTNKETHQALNREAVEASPKQHRNLRLVDSEDLRGLLLGENTFRDDRADPVDELGFEIQLFWLGKP